ncbi:MAG: GTP cyclohydrolase I FolE [Dolichospermum sp.]
MHQNLSQAISLVSQAMHLVWGDLLDTPSMEDTPERVVKYWLECSSGLYEDPAIPLQKQFEVNSDEIVIVKNIQFQSVCEHHILPILGTASIAYIPTDKVVGLSKIPRAFDILCRRPQLQERLTAQIGELLDKTLNPKGVAVIIAGEHTCMTGRGVRKTGTVTKTSFMSGVFRNDAMARAEVLQLLRD